MKRHRMIVSILVLVPAVCAVLQSSAMAGSLLGGYGGPGEGNQAIIGATLLNGPRSGSGGGSGGRGGSLRATDSGASESSAESSSSSSGGGNALGGDVPRSARSGADPKATPPSESRSTGGGHGADETRPRGSAGTAGNASGTPASLYAAAERDAAVRPAAAADAGTLGLSGADILYGLLALGVLALTAVFTRRLTLTAAGRHD